MITFLLANIFLVAMTLLAAAQAVLSIATGNYQNAVVMAGFALADAGLLWIAHG